MALRKIRILGDDILRKKSKPVTKIDDRISTLLKDMADTLHNTENGAAIAAPQVGVLRRAIVIDMGEGIINMVNPEIIETEGSQEVIEGCLSIPGKWGKLMRPAKVKVKALNENGEEFTITGEEDLAKCLCHEIDHLEGILFIDKVTEFIEEENQEEWNGRHTATGFDMNDYMLERIPGKAKDLASINFSKADAISDDWGYGYDTVILAGNILINIVSDLTYKQAQKLFIKKAYYCLKPNGHLYLDFNCFSHPEDIFGSSDERIIFEGVDSFGNYGKEMLFDSTYDPQTQITTFRRKTEIVAKNGEKIVRESVGVKHIPTLLQVRGWLGEAGFKVVSEYGDYKGEPISETTSRAIIWAEKV